MTRACFKSCPLAVLLLAAVIMSWCAITSPLKAENAITITSDGSTAGYLTLDWSESGATQPYKLQMDKGSGWQTIYEGADTATTLTGLKNGNYRFRINSADPATIDDDLWQPPLSVEIAHHSQTKAFTFFFSGLLIFLILLWLLFFTGQKTTQPEA